MDLSLSHAAVRKKVLFIFREPLYFELDYLSARLHYVTKPCDIRHMTVCLITFNIGLGLGPFKKRSGGGFQEGCRVGGCAGWGFCLEGS